MKMKSLINSEGNLQLTTLATSLFFPCSVPLKIKVLKGDGEKSLQLEEEVPLTF